MYIHGEFLDRYGRAIGVHILSQNDDGDVIEIGATNDALLQFTDDPVEIDCEINDCFDHIIRHSCTIHLETRGYVEGLFASSPFDVSVTITREGACLFCGFVEPQAYSQDFNNAYDDLDINCIDVLSALQYVNYGGVGLNGVDYDDEKADAGNINLHDVFFGGEGKLAELTVDAVAVSTDNLAELSVYDATSGCIWGWFAEAASVFTSEYSSTSISHYLYIDSLLFFGDDESDMWTYEDVLDEYMRYLNLHIVQIGTAFYIYSWDTVRGGSFTWDYHLFNSTGLTTGASDFKANTLPSLVEDSTSAALTLTTRNVADNATTLSVGEVFNKIELTCSITDIEDVVSSPLDDDDIYSGYTAVQKYMTEYCSRGDGKKAHTAFRAMLVGDTTTTYGDAWYEDWYIKPLLNDNWSFRWTCTDSGADYEDTLSGYITGGTNAHILPWKMCMFPMCALLQFGSIQTYAHQTDNSSSSISKTNYLVISVNGNGGDYGDDDLYPSDDDIAACIPYATYKGASSGNYSPSDSSVTNYIVLSGSLKLVPRMDITWGYNKLIDNADDWDGSAYSLTNSAFTFKKSQTTETLDSGLEETGGLITFDDGSRYIYTRALWQAESPKDSVSARSDATDSLLPPTDNAPKDYEFKYSAVGDSSDTISKISVLACMLIIGDKCVVETGTDGSVSDFSWQTYKTLDECEDEDEYYQQCFYIGFDPAIGDELIGTEFDFQNNITSDINIDAEGIAIPITKDDGLSGKVEFKILGPVNIMWDEITRRHPTFFRSTKWTSSQVALLAKIQSIMLSDFEVKIYSDNSGTEADSLSGTSNDIVFASDTVETFANVKDDITFRFTSGLTAAECTALGVETTISRGTVVDSSGDAVMSIYESTTQETAKAEQLYVDAYYRECHSPRVELTQNMEDTAGNVSLFRHYVHPALSNEFYVLGISRDLIQGTAELKLKEVIDD